MCEDFICCIRHERIMMSYTSEIKKIVEALKKIDYIKPDDLPNIDLYMDQVTTFMDRHLETTRRFSEDKLLTKTMINNYTKNNLLPSPEKKKYGKDHLFLLIYIYYMKNFLSINDIQKVLSPLTERYFNAKDGIKFDDIYNEVFKLEKQQSYTITKDILDKYTLVSHEFKDIPDKDEQDELKKFLFISELCFDVYMKKQLIETIIDDDSKSSDNNEKE